jgi:hypothetical protein
MPRISYLDRLCYSGTTGLVELVDLGKMGLRVTRLSTESGGRRPTMVGRAADAQGIQYSSINTQNLWGVVMNPLV